MPPDSTSSPQEVLYPSIRQGERKVGEIYSPKAPAVCGNAVAAVENEGSNSIGHPVFPPLGDFAFALFNSPIPIEAACPFGYTEAMTTKEKAVQAVQALPDDASIEDAMERLFLLAKIEKGLQQADAGELIPHEKVKERMAKWLR